MRTLESHEIVEILSGGKGGKRKQYRLLVESPKTVNLSMIPTPNELEKRIKGKDL